MNLPIKTDFGYHVGCLSVAKDVPLPKGTNYGHRLLFRLTLCYCPCSPSNRKHVKVHLSAYKQMVHYILYWAEYVPPALSPPLHYFPDISHSMHYDSIVITKPNQCTQFITITIMFHYVNTYMFRASIAHHQGVHS